MWQKTTLSTSKTNPIEHSLFEFGSNLERYHCLHIQLLVDAVARYAHRLGWNPDVVLKGCFHQSHQATQAAKLLELFIFRKWAATGMLPACTTDAQRNSTSTIKSNLTVPVFKRSTCFYLWALSNPSNPFKGTRFTDSGPAAVALSQRQRFVQNPAREGAGNALHCLRKLVITDLFG